MIEFFDGMLEKYGSTENCLGPRAAIEESNSLESAIVSVQQ